jgi:hypothetical protein
MMPQKIFLLAAICLAIPSLSAQADKEVLRLVQNNKIPDNIQLTCNYEELENGHWKLRERETLLWDFKNQRIQLESLALSSDEMKHIAYEKTVLANGKLLGNTEWFSQKSKDLSPKMVLLDNQCFEKVKKLQRGRISSRVLMFDFGKFEHFYTNYFFTWNGLLFTQALERGIQGGTAVSLHSLKDTTELVLSSKDRSTIVYSFDTETGMKKSKTVLEKDMSGVESKKEHYEIIKTKQIGNYNIPTEMHIDFRRPGVGSQASSDYVKCRIIVDDTSILINHELKDSDFKLKIPVGAEVGDLPKGIFYISDGITGDPEIHERLEDALEETIREATQQKK